jgi:hypothetical protein
MKRTVRTLVRRVLAVASVLAMGVASHAETHYVAHVAVGGHGGVSLSRMSFSPSFDQSWHQGAIVGASITYAEEKLVGVTAELNFEQRGWKESFDDPSLSYSRTLNYIELPIMTHIQFGPRRFKTFINLGPEFSYMISDKISSNFDYNAPTTVGIAASRQVEQMVTDVKTKFDYGIAVGLGGEYYLRPRQSVTLEARFYYGLGNIFPSSKADTFSASRGMSLTVTAGYNFRLK